MTKPQYGEPWKWGDEGVDIVCKSDGQEVLAGIVEEKFSLRAMLCVNALAGLNPEAVRELLEACKTARRLYDDMSLGPLEAATKYGANYVAPTDEDCLRVRGKIDAAITKAENRSTP